MHQQNRAVRNEDLPREPFHKDDVIQHWKRIAHHFRTNDQEQVFMVMTKRDPVQIDERTFQFETDNSIQATRIESVMEEIMAYLRKEVKNYDLIIKVEIAQQAEDETKYLTGKDKFDRMARVNTNLLDLKNRFNLDIEP